MKFRNNKCFKISSIKILANSNWIYEYVASDYNCFCLLLAIYKLGEICKYIEGYVNPPINDQTFFGENIINWMRVKDLKHNNKINKTQLTLSKKCFNLIKNKNQIFKKDSIVWSKSGTVGNVGLLDIDVCANRGVLNILPNEKVYKKYLYYILSKNKYKFQNLATGAVLKHFYGPNLMNFEVFLPNKSTQKQIIDIIKPIEKLINLIKKIIWKVEIIKRKIYTYSIFKIEKLENIAFAKSGKQPPLNYHINNEKEGYTRFIQNRDYSNYKIKSYIPSNFKGVKVTKKDILIDKYGEPGKTRYGINGFINVAMLRLIPFENKNKESIRNHFENEELLKWLKRASQASTRPSLNWNFLKTLTIGLSSSNDLLSWLLSIELKFKKTNLILIQLKDLLVKILII